MTPEFALHYAGFIKDYGDFPDQEKLKAMIRSFYG
jgi:hypothetical protein